jgi:hypothetical protein
VIGAACHLWVWLVLQAKVLLKSLEALSPKAAEGAQAHAEKSKSIQQRAAKLVSGL